MRRFPTYVVLPLLLSTTALTSCSKSPRDRLQGKWVGESVAEVHPSQAAQALGWAKGTVLEFAGNKVTVAVPAETPRTGTFKVEKVEGDKLDLVLRRSGGGEDRTRVSLSEDGKLLWSLGGGVQLLLRRDGD